MLVQETLCLYTKLILVAETPCEYWYQKDQVSILVQKKHVNTGTSSIMLIYHVNTGARTTMLIYHINAGATNTMLIYHVNTGTRKHHVNTCNRNTMLILVPVTPC